jgi:hypothetical protein
MSFKLLVFLNNHSHNLFLVSVLAHCRSSLDPCLLPNSLVQVKCDKPEPQKSTRRYPSTHTPSSFFGVWRKLSGGDERLNTTERITPLAFVLGQGHHSPYDIASDEFTATVYGHCGIAYVATEFSSSSHSPSFVLGFYYGTEYISVIDTKELQDTNPTYYVPLMPGRGPADFEMMEHEYLVFGVVEGSAHYAVPYEKFAALVFAPDR